MVSHQDAIQLAAILGDPALRPLTSGPEFTQALRPPAPPGTGAISWPPMIGPTRTFFGDQANLGREQAKRSNNWVIAGTGGTGISAAEIILSENQKARVMMIGADRPAGLFENDQFRALAGAACRRSARSRARPPAWRRPPPRTGRSRRCTDRTRPTSPGTTPANWVDESDIPAHLRSRRFYDSNGSRPDPHATAYVAALGRADDYPPLVANLIDQTRRWAVSIPVNAQFQSIDNTYELPGQVLR